MVLRPGWHDVDCFSGLFRRRMTTECITCNWFSPFADCIRFLSHSFSCPLQPFLTPYFRRFIENLLSKNIYLTNQPKIESETNLFAPSKLAALLLAACPHLLLLTHFSSTTQSFCSRHNIRLWPKLELSDITMFSSVANGVIWLALMIHHGLVVGTSTSHFRLSLSRQLLFPHDCARQKRMACSSSLVSIANPAKSKLSSNIVRGNRIQFDQKLIFRWCRFIQCEPWSIRILKHMNFIDEPEPY